MVQKHDGSYDEKSHEHRGRNLISHVSDVEKRRTNQQRVKKMVLEI
jgi:hypothetical protein